MFVPLRLLRGELQGRVRSQPLRAPVCLHTQAKLLPWLHLRLHQQLLRTVLREQVSAAPSPTRHAGLCSTCNNSLKHPACCLALSCTLKLLLFSIRNDQPCPKGWWGHPMCGPCNCDTSKGFDPDCNKTTGECRCKVSSRCDLQSCDSA